MKEARGINNSFLNACHDQDPSKIIQLDAENPFIEEENQVATRVGYHYNIWKLQEADAATGRKEKRICVRCSVHSHNNQSKEGGEGKQLMNVYTLNEHNLDIKNWRSCIDQAIIPCLNKEITNNSFKISRWLVQSILAQVDFIKFGFVTRKNMNDNKKHILVATHTVPTTNWAQQLSLQMDQMWSKVKYLIDSIEEDKKDEMESAEYIMLKDFNKLAYRLYKKDLQEEEEDDEEEDN